MANEEIPESWQSSGEVRIDKLESTLSEVIVMDVNDWV